MASNKKLGIGTKPATPPAPALPPEAPLTLLHLSAREVLVARNGSTRAAATQQVRGTSEADLRKLVAPFTPNAEEVAPLPPGHSDDDLEVPDTDVVDCEDDLE